MIAPAHIVLNCTRLAAVLCVAFASVPLTAQQAEYDEYPYDADASISVGYVSSWGDSRLDATRMSDDSVGPSGSCGLFESGRSSGMWGAIGVTWRPLSNLFFQVDGGVSFVSHDLDFSCIDPAEIRLPDGSTDPALTRHHLTFNTVLTHVSVGPVISPGTQLPVRVGLSGSVFVHATNPEYEAYEEIEEPVSAEFVSGGQRRIYGRDDLFEGSAAIQFGASVSLSYDLPAGGLWYLRPTVIGEYVPRIDARGGEVGEYRLRLGVGLAREFELSSRAPTPLSPDR